MTLAPVDTWPDLRVTVHVLPWSWRIKPYFYVDDVDGAKGHWSFSWWFLVIEWWGNKRLFTEPHNAVPAESPASHTDLSQSDTTGPGTIEGRIFKSRAGSEVRDVCVDSWKKADAEHREETESERELRQGARALRRQWM